MQRSTAAFFLSLVLTGGTVATSFAAQVAFVGPKDWSKVDAGATASTATRTFDQWKLGSGADSQTVTVVHDTTTTYDQTLAAMHEHFTSSDMKPSVDKDEPCQGKTAHVIEFMFGPEGKEFITNRLVVPDDTTGVITVTYSRQKSFPFDDELKSAEDAFCKAS